MHVMFKEFHLIYGIVFVLSKIKFFSIKMCVLNSAVHKRERDTQISRFRFRSMQAGFKSK